MIDTTTTTIISVFSILFRMYVKRMFFRFLEPESGL